MQEQLRFMDEDKKKTNGQDTEQSMTIYPSMHSFLYGYFLSVTVITSCSANSIRDNTRILLISTSSPSCYYY